jgi:AraC-like DNA-binding protein
MVSSQDQRVFILEHYFSTRSYAECQNAFRNSFPDSVVPNKSTIQRLVDRLREARSTGEKRCSGRPSVLSNDSLEDTRARLLQSPRKSLRKFSQQTGMTLTKRLKLHPYRVLLAHGLRDFWITLYIAIGSTCTPGSSVSIVSGYGRTTGRSRFDLLQM